MSRKKHKPHDPAAAARHRQEREEGREMIAAIRAQPSTEVVTDPRTGRLTHAKRLNCFNTLLAPGGPERAAVDWLDELVRTANGENGQERRPDYIRASNDGAPGQNISDVMIAASERLAAVTSAMAPQHARMLLELLKPDADLITRWRGVVERCTGETNGQAQGAAVRAACAALVWARESSHTVTRWRYAKAL